MPLRTHPSSPSPSRSVTQTPDSPDASSFPASYHLPPSHPPPACLFSLPASTAPHHAHHTSNYNCPSCLLLRLISSGAGYQSPAPALSLLAPALPFSAPSVGVLEAFGSHPLHTPSQASCLPQSTHLFRELVI